MTGKPKTLSNTARTVLIRAADHPDRLASFDRKLPAGARNKIIDSLLRQGLLEETAGAYRTALITEQDGGMRLTTLRITYAGFRAIGAEPPTAPHTASADAVAHRKPPRSPTPLTPRPLRPPGPTGATPCATPPRHCSTPGAASPAWTRSRSPKP
jgi:hypothetical protein